MQLDQAQFPDGSRAGAWGCDGAGRVKVPRQGQAGTVGQCSALWLAEVSRGLVLACCLMALTGLPSENKASCRNSGLVMRCIVKPGQFARTTHPIPTPLTAHNLGAWKSSPALKMARTPLLGTSPKFHSCFDVHLTSSLPVLKSICF